MLNFRGVGHQSTLVMDCLASLLSGIVTVCQTDDAI